MVVSMALGSSRRRICYGSRTRELELVAVKVYNAKQLSETLLIGKNRAYEIMKAYGFRTGNTERSPLRITEKGVTRYVEAHVLVDKRRQ